MAYDFFVSHQHEDLPFVEALVSELERRNYSCWYAPRNVKGQYARAIVDAISHSRVFLLILNKRSIVSQAVLNEVETAQNYMKQGKYASIQPVVTEELDCDDPAYADMMFYVRRFHFLNYNSNEDINIVADGIIRCQSDRLTKKQKRTESAYISQEIEDRRLDIQNSIFGLFDGSIYRSILHKYPSPTILDIGCGSGAMIVDKLSETEGYTLFGVDKSERQIEIASKKYGSDHVHFFTEDVESLRFEGFLREITKENNIDGFDIINVSMVLLHLKKPGKLLKILHDFLNDGGTIIIRDIDDGLNFAYPDSDNSFDRIYRMCDRDEESGVRRTGRQIYTLLTQAGYSEVHLEKQGLTSIGMDDDQKEGLFCLYFPFTLANAEKMYKKHPRDSEIRSDFLWYKKNYEYIHKKFMKKDFVFSIGLVAYTAIK